MVSGEIQKRLTFVIELDRLKSVVRQSPLADRSRKENSAEHSWHLAMFALAFAEQDGAVDACRALRMLLIHDIVEIDAGDTPIHGPGAELAVQQEAELAAARRIFGLCPTSKAMSFSSYGRNLRGARRLPPPSPRRWTDSNRCCLIR